MAEAVKKPSADEVYQGLTGTQKCAILMMLIGEDEAAEIMKNLSPKEVQTLGSAMYSVQGLPQETVNLVLDEFQEGIEVLQMAENGRRHGDISSGVQN